MFHKLQNYDSYCIFQELETHDFKITYTKNNIKICNSVHFLNNSLNNLVRNLGENDFYHLSQESEANTLYLVKKKGFFPP